MFLTDLDLFDRVLALHRGDLRGTVQAIIDAARKSDGKPFDAVRALAAAPAPGSPG